MAFTALSQFKLPLDVVERIEDLLFLEYQQAFIRRYGRSMPSREMTFATGNHIGTILCMPSLPGFRLYGFSLFAHHKLAIGMPFLTMSTMHLGAYTIQRKTDLGFIVTGWTDPTEQFMSFASLRGVILFVSSPNEYMLFVGKDRYTGDLTDLLPLADGEDMSELEMDIRQAAAERAEEVDFVEYECDGGFDWSPVSAHDD